MAFVPSRDISVIQLSADKIAAYLTKALGRPVRSVTLTSYAAVAQALSAKTADLAWVGPLDYLISHEQNGAYPVTCSVRAGARGYKAFIIAKSRQRHQYRRRPQGQDLRARRRRLGLQQPGAARRDDQGRAQPGQGHQDASTSPTRAQSRIAVYEGKADAGAIYDDARTNKEVIAQVPRHPDQDEDHLHLRPDPLRPADRAQRPHQRPWSSRSRPRC